MTNSIKKEIKDIICSKLKEYIYQINPNIPHSEVLILSKEWTIDLYSYIDEYVNHK